MTQPDGSQWDMTVVHVERRGRWWWNAYKKVGGIELSGWADTREAAMQAMQEATGAAEYGGGIEPSGEHDQGRPDR